MSRPAEQHRIRPWLIVWKMDYPGALPTQAFCEVCGVGKRIQGTNSYAMFLRSHRRCGLIHAIHSLSTALCVDLGERIADSEKTKPQER